ncbi:MULTISPECIES: hypothetical protein [Fischerella]|uniref:hypothetical protein n=1 Tax=Fischerella TaxID=1190 RepID=UPI0002FC4BF5|nr:MULTISPECIES: hypothetical protein [Fischerella]
MSEVPSDVVESRVIVTFLEAKPVQSTPQMMYFGMLAASNQHSSEEDFKVDLLKEEVWFTVT